MINNDPELNKRIQRDAATLLYGNAIAGVFISLLTSSFLVFAFSDPLTDSFKQLWWLGMTLLLGVRMFDIIRWKIKFKNTNFDGNKAINRFILGVNPTAIMWAIYLVYITTHNSDIELTTTIIAIAAMAGGSPTVLAAHKYTAMFYSFVLLSPGSFVLVLSEEYAFQLLGILGFSFSIVMIIISKKSADFTLHTLFLKNENVALLHHMEEQVEQRTQKIHQLSNLDPLTQLFNRTAFLSQLKSLIRITDKPFALLFIDLDGFKKINDSIGHKAGDQILIKTSDRLKQFVPDQQLLCRWGGDEFLIALIDTDKESAVELSEKLIVKLSEHHNTESNILSVGATIGIAFYPDNAMTEERLIQLADMAMYYQKKRKRSTVGVYSKEMEHSHSHELRLKNGLTKAIDKKELRLVFQPIIRSNNYEISAFEALIRWQFEGKNIPPDEFICIAEQYGSIHEIGAWVLKNACWQASQWNIGKPVAVCVNVSVIQLQDEHFMSIVEEALTSSSLLPELLHIEITESVFASDINIISNQIKSLQSKGIKVSIDDFGTGYSSLSVMQSLAVDMVKIDRSFVNKINSNGDAIISAVMHIASSLNFLVVAEGVENEEQAQKLLKLGVHYFQGFYYSKPLEVENIPSFLSRTSYFVHPGKTLLPKKL